MKLVYYWTGDVSSPVVMIDEDKQKAVLRIDNDEDRQYYPDTAGGYLWGVNDILHYLNPEKGYEQVSVHYINEDNLADFKDTLTKYGAYDCFADYFKR